MWNFNNALKYRQPQTQSRIYAMLGETYMALNRPQSAVNSFQMAIQKGAQDSHIFARLGDAFSGMSDFSDAQSAYRTSLNINPQDTVALAGVSVIEKKQNAHGGKDKRS